MEAESWGNSYASAVDKGALTFQLMEKLNFVSNLGLCLILLTH